MLYSVDREGWIHTFKDSVDAENSIEWSEIESSAYVTLDDQGVLYEHYYEADHGYCGYVLRATKLKLPDALEILQQHAGIRKLGSAELQALALCLSRYATTVRWHP
jgi:hypothetical protein